MSASASPARRTPRTLYPLIALGPGLRPIPGIHSNTDIFGHYLDFARIQFQNPQEPLVTDASSPEPDPYLAERVHEYMLA